MRPTLLAFAILMASTFGLALGQEEDRANYATAEDKFKQARQKFDAAAAKYIEAAKQVKPPEVIAAFEIKYSSSDDDKDPGDEVGHELQLKGHGTVSTGRSGKGERWSKSTSKTIVFALAKENYIPVGGKIEGELVIKKFHDFNWNRAGVEVTAVTNESWPSPPGH